jgi:cytochrome c
MTDHNALRRNCANRITFSVIFCGMLMLGSNPSAQAAGDPKRGADVFDGECAECHSIKQGKNKKGPSLFGIVGQKAAGVSDFVYSDALKNGGITWTADRLDSYIANPNQAVPGGKMGKKFDGLADPQGRADVIAFLNAQH